ncbi:MAG: aspartoacylase [Stenomitos rutilans HA7619-LM2]|jgi:aspartoacylase|nr:aspartoacylase [Stenomitos rutilans HA7619-LM2]
MIQEAINEETKSTAATVIRRVAIVGGTHGNELTGVYLIKKFEQFPTLLHRSSFEAIPLLANPAAVAMNQRYVDRDLNRCFAREDLSNPALATYEDKRAKEIAAQLGPREQPKVNVIIDLHSTTSNMGLSLLPSSKAPFNLRLAAYLSRLHPEVRVCCGEQCDQDAPLLRSLTPLGCTLEVGAIAQGALDAHYFQQTEQLIRAILDYIDANNKGQPPSAPRTLTTYQAIASVDYPRNAAGELDAMIHPQLQHRDYEPLFPGAPLFLTFTGETLPYPGETTVFPVFINEAAYYEKGIAMVLTEKQEITIPDGA